MNPEGLKNLVKEKFYPMQQQDSHEFLMHIISSLQDETTPLNRVKFDGEVSDLNCTRTSVDINREYFESNPSIIDSTFIGIEKNIVECANCNY
jgi:ubiquitin C-terminal hydrolase